MKKKVLVSAVSVLSCFSLVVSLVASAIVTEASIISGCAWVAKEAISTSLEVVQKAEQYEDYIKKLDEYSNSRIFADSCSVDYSTKTGSNVFITPVYCFSGKIRLDYTNGNYEVISLKISLATNDDPLTSFSVADKRPSVYGDYSEYVWGGSPDWQINKFGTANFVRTSYNSGGVILDSHSFAYEYDYMPYIVFVGSGGYRYGFDVTHNGAGYYYGYNPTTSTYFKTHYNSNTNSRNFFVSDINSITWDSGLDWDSRYSDSAFVFGDYSLTSYYAVECYSNNSEFIDDMQTKYNTLNYGHGFQPILKKVGLSARLNITNSNVSNYNDYGLYYNNNTNELNFNNTTYVNNFNSLDLPKISTEWNNKFVDMPDIGVNFDSDVRYNYVDIVYNGGSVGGSGGGSGLPDDWLTVYPSWEPETYIIVTTVPEFPTAPAIGSNVVEGAKEYISIGHDVYSSFADLYSIAILGLILGFSVWIFKR